MAVTTDSRTSRGVTGPVLVGGAFLLSTGVNLLFKVGELLFTDGDPHRPQGPIDSIVSISVVGVAGLALALAIALPLRADPGRARIGAVVLGALAVVTAPFFWSGAPAAFGAAAAWTAGLSKGEKPLTGVARGFGIVGFVVAVLILIAVFVGALAGVFTGG
ncbi:hypothetical protein KOI35_10895 [Actinoplanes bogorensis]|uniref:Tripartite tricarboxylate transporter TctB family protein n=1 Tax=Paractinoplanes bogorensis TaxID=1610840 RepID=A0ABS5YLS6_9ACTN|nr:hypothetical protein [Actinoplanes bogorensis]MBU2663996.1 hypothetical protein [Actinoplanes bogorensis]